MAGYGGYFMQGLASGLQSGVNLGMQVTQMKWQKAERKRLQDNQNMLMESAGNFNNMVSQLGVDGSYSDDDNMRINTAFMALGYEVKGMVDGTMKALQSINKAVVEENNQWFSLLPSFIEGLDIKNTQAVFDSVKEFVKGEKPLQMFEAYESIAMKQKEAAINAPEDVWGQAEKLPQDIRPEYLRSKGVKIPEKEPTVTTPKIGDLDSALGFMSKYADSPMFDNAANWVADTYKIDRNLLTKEATQEWLNQKQTAKATTADRATSLPQLEKYRQDIKDAETIKEARRLYKTYADEYDEEQLGIGDVDEYWVEGQTEYLDNINTVLKKLIDEKGWLKKGYLTSDEAGIKFKDETKDGVIIGQKTEKIYETLRESYMEYRDTLEEMGVDVSQFPKLKPFTEIEKVGFGEGFWGAGKQKGQYKSIYY